MKFFKTVAILIVGVGLVIPGGVAFSTPDTVADLEVKLAKASKNAETARIDYAVAAEEALEIRAQLEEAESRVLASKKSTQKAKKELEESLLSVSTIAQDFYRGGGAPALPMITPSLRDVEQAEVLREVAAKEVDSKLQEVSALSHIEEVLQRDALKNAGEVRELSLEAEEKTLELEVLATEAERAEEVAAAEVSELLEKLAKERETSKREEAERLKKVEKKREENARRAALEEREKAKKEREKVEVVERGKLKVDSPAAPASTSSDFDVESVIDFAFLQLGKPYLWGSSGPDSYDCSGLVTAAYQSVGVTLPHQSGLQYKAVPKVPLDERKRGDLIFWERDDVVYHVAIYLGDDEIIHASSPKTPLGVATLYNWENLTEYVGRVQ